MKLRRFTTLLTLIIGAWFGPAQAAVLRYTVGIDVNCPAGLGE